MGTFFTLACAGLLEPKRSALGLLKSAFNAENFIMQVVLVYLQAFPRNSLLKCALQPKIATNSLKTPFWGGGSKSFKVIDVIKLESL